MGLRGRVECEIRDHQATIACPPRSGRLSPARFSWTHSIARTSDLGERAVREGDARVLSSLECIDVQEERADA